MTEATHRNGTSHDVNVNTPTVEASVKPRSHERLRAAWQKLTTTKTAVLAVVSGVLLTGAAYAAKVYLDKK